MDGLEERPNSLYEFGDPDGILSLSGIRDTLGIGDLSGASSISSDATTSLADLASVTYSSDLHDGTHRTAEKPPSRPENSTPKTDPATELAATPEDSSQRYAETELGPALPPAPGEEGHDPQSDPTRQTGGPLPTGPRHRGAGRQSADLWGAEGSGRSQEVPRGVLRPELRQPGVPDGDEAGRASQVDGEPDGGFGNDGVQDVDHELYDHPYIAPEDRIYDQDEVAQEPGVGRRLFSGDASLYGINSDLYGDGATFYGDDNDLRAEDLDVYDPARAPYGDGMGAPGDIRLEPGVLVRQGAAGVLSWRREQFPKRRPPEGRLSAPPAEAAYGNDVQQGIEPSREQVQ